MTTAKVWTASTVAITNGSCCQPHSAVSSERPTDAPGLYLPTFKHDMRRDWILELATPWILEPSEIWPGPLLYAQLIFDDPVPGEL
eukprot:4151263-Pyramimonas_sp.AAC.1